MGFPWGAARAVKGFKGHSSIVFNVSVPIK